MIDLAFARLQDSAAPLALAGSSSVRGLLYLAGKLAAHQRT
jgi:hypothetical protein